MEIFVTSTLGALITNKLANTIFAQESPNYKLPRADSEYTLGFERSKSARFILSELGPLCSTGQVFVNVMKYAGVSALAICGISITVHFIFQKKKSI